MRYPYELWSIEPHTYRWVGPNRYAPALRRLISRHRYARTALAALRRCSTYDNVAILTGDARCTVSEHELEAMS